MHYAVLVSVALLFTRGRHSRWLRIFDLFFFPDATLQGFASPAGMELEIFHLLLNV